MGGFMAQPLSGKNEHSGYTTRPSHLLKLSEEDENAWSEFYNKYKAMIWAIGSRMGLSESDREDLLQDVAMVCCNRLKSFYYDPEKCRFRSFLFGIVRNVAFNIRRKNQKLVRSEKVMRDYDAFPGLDVQFMREYETFLLGKSLAILKESVDSATYLVFEQLVLEEKPVDEVVRISGKTSGAVYSIKHRCLKKLDAIITDLNRKLETPPERG